MLEQFDKVGNAVQEAFKTTDEAFGHETDPDLRIYDKLNTPEHTQKLVNRYGLEQVAKYVKAMELKRLGVE